MTGLHEADRQLASVGVDSSSTLFVIGLGTGAVLDALDRRGWTGRVVAFEPNPALVAARNWGHWSRDARLTVLVGPGFDGLDRVIPSIEPERAQPVMVVNYDVAATAPDAAKDAMRVAARAWFGARANQEARKEFAGPYLLNTLRNVATIAAEGDAARLANAFSGVPAIVVGAGPSLDRNLDAIAAQRDRAIVVAADTALRPLLAAGIEPDLVVAVDPGEANARHLSDLAPCPGTWLVAEGSLDPAALASFAGRAFVFRVSDHHPWPWLETIGLDRGRLRAWGSVLTTAFDLALVMGCEPIVFAGADLAFTGGQPYARGTSYEADWRNEAAWGATLDSIWALRVNAWPEVFETGIDGAPVRTAPHLRSFRDWIVREAAKSQRMVVNASGSGILAGDGVRQASIAGAIGAGRRPESVPERLSKLQAARAAAPALTLPSDVPADVRRSWITFAGVTEAALDDALGTRRAVVVAPADTPERLPDDDGLAHRDAAFLAELNRSCRVRRVRLTNPEQDLLVELRRELTGLEADEALVVIDDLDLAAGSQVRRALDRVLCDRPDVWVEYRRFVDHRSRVSVIRTGASSHTPLAHEADADKWTAGHQDIADRLSPIVAAELKPGSVVDLGCGAGYWLRALAAAGASTVVGVTPRHDGAVAVPDVVRAPLEQTPDLGRRFDVCLCLDVIQQFAPDSHDAIIDACARLSDVVVFSSRVPGTPGTSPHARPLTHWAAAFWRRGYVLDDSLRGLAEERWDFPHSVYDCFVIFRRQFEPDRAADDSPEGRALTSFVLRSATRIHELYTKSVFWATAAINSRPTPTLAPHSPVVRLRMSPARLNRAGEAARMFRFQSDAARWYLTHQAMTLEVFEDGCRLKNVGDVGALPSARGGGWVIRRDEITVKSSDGSDPRTNGREYTVAVPAYVAWAESRPTEECAANGF